MKKLTCHCGGVEAEVNVPEKFEKVIRCNCSICKRKGYVMSMISENDLKHQNIVVDKSSMLMLKGSEVDFSEELIGNSFKISNPKT